MTVSTTDNKEVYTADGIEVMYSYDFRMDYDEDMEVYLNEILVPASEYTIARAGDNIGGTVTFDIAPVLDTTITLLRSLDMTQETDYIAGDPFPAEAHEDALDKQTMLIQQVQEQVDRNSQAIGGEEGVDTSAPPFIAGKAWKWSDGNPDKKLINSTYDPDEQAGIASGFAVDASNSASSANASANNSQLEAWIAEAEKMTADSYATEPHNILVKAYTSNGDGTFTSTDTAEYSSFHWSIEAVGAGGLPDAPNDGNSYIRDSLFWVQGVLKTTFDTVVAQLATIESPIFTGSPRAPTPADNSAPTAVATTQFVIDNAGGGSFTELDDTPSDYVDNAGKVATVNGTEDGLIFEDVSSVEDFTDLTDTPTDYIGQGGKALTVNTAEDAIEFTDNTVEAQPIGSFIHFGGSVAPPGYLSCLGQVVTQAQYPDLYAAIGDRWNNTAGASTPAVGSFRLPPQNVDGLGLYMRGSGGATAVGEYQADVLKEHTHTVEEILGGSSATKGDSGGVFNASRATYTSQPTGDPTETRPRSITTLLCIKATYSAFTGNLGDVPVNSVDTAQTIGPSATFTTSDGKTITVVNGLIAGVV